MSDREKRSRWKAFHLLHARIAAAWQERDYTYPPPKFPTLPDDLRGLTCGARTRAGTPCKQKSIYLNGRCKLHGGLSTGPTTPEGRERIRQAQLRRWAKAKLDVE